MEALPASGDDHPGVVNGAQRISSTANPGPAPSRVLLSISTA
jgi:hypothetical protein